jgi:O-antigen ligase
LLLKDTIKHKLSFLILIIPLGSALIFSVCQTAQLMFLVGFAVYFAFPYASKWAWVGLKAIIMILMVIAPFTVGFVFHHFAHSLMDVNVVKDASGGARLEIWDYVSRYALQHPFFGYGADVTRTITDFDCAYVFNTINLVNHPHNFVLQIWIEYGLFGILITMGVIYKALTLIQTQYSIAQQKILLPTFLAGMVAASTAYGLWQGMWIGAMFFAAAMAILASRIVIDNSQGENAIHLQ